MTTQLREPAFDYLPTWTNAKGHWFVRADGSRLRYVVAGDGPPLVLMHTVRTQLDYFQRVIPLLTASYRVYAVDFPGMGWSDIQPGAHYDHADLQAAIVEFVRGLDLTDVTLAGESMGATIALTGSVELGERVTRVVASNTYDYPQGLERANLLARVIVSSVRAPLIGPTFASLENKPIVKGIMGGGYADPSRLPAPFLDELMRVGNRPGYSRVARAVYRNLPTLIAARSTYPAITAPVTLVYSDKDWSRSADRKVTAAAIPTATVREIVNAGHFSALEKPHAFADALLSPR
ncbi:alpha/beta hydrolase [Mycobacterium hackensackense]|uniref:alpha/beta fold hydrolase n=1 Tax=Mycobacterium hackensackense TaxID=228909 RepID=UPI002265CFA0|nr:alpha/beta hydrolase [Mycobacterium hackensackense]MCV7256264.1 alpha/beta hydrolase [Mycobacterium hackensackense]